MNPRPRTTDASTADDQRNRWEVTAALAREVDHELEDATLDHPRDNVERLETLCRRYFTSDPTIYMGEGDADVAEATVDGDEGRLQMVVESDQQLTPRMARLALRRQVLPRYNEETNRETPANRGFLVAAVIDGRDKPRGSPTRSAAKRLGKRVTDEEWEDAKERVADMDLGPESAPDLALQEAHVRPLAGAPSPIFDERTSDRGRL